MAKVEDRSVGEDLWKLKLSHVLGGVHCSETLAAPTKAEHRHPHDPAIPLPGAYASMWAPPNTYRDVHCSTIHNSSNLRTPKWININLME